MSFADVRGVRISFHLVLLRVLFLAVCLNSLTAAAGDTSVVKPESGAGQHNSLFFNIPAQALHEALFAYTDVTGSSVLVDDEIASGRRSTQVKGTFTREGALRTLLNGTGLEFQYTAANAFTLIPTGVTAVGPALRDGSHDERYFRVIQTAMKHVLCSRADTLPGAYRVVIQLWIGLSGTVVRSALVGSTGNRDRDNMLTEMMGGLQVGEAPPAGLPQPVTLVVLPRAPSVTGDCADDEAPTKVRG